MSRFVIWAILAIIPLSNAFQLLSLSFHTENSFLDRQINSTLNNMAKDYAKQDPYEIPVYDYQTLNDLWSGKARLQDLSINGYSKFYADRLNFTLSTGIIEIDIKLNKLQIFISQYSFDVKIGFVPLFGTGSLILKLDKLDLSGVGHAIIKMQGLKAVEDIKALFKVDGTNLQLSGLLGNEQLSHLVSNALSECLPEFVYKYNALIGEMLSPILQNLVNDAIK